MSAPGDIYRGRDPRDLPVYTLTDAARYLHMSSSTLRSWVLGRRYPTAEGDRFFAPPIELPDSQPSLLSFFNLVEAHVLLAIRRRHRVPMREVRVALDYAQEKEGIDRLLVREELRAEPTTSAQRGGILVGAVNAKIEYNKLTPHITSPRERPAKPIREPLSEQAHRMPALCEGRRLVRGHECADSF